MATREELYAKFGITAEAAQLFETELGTLLLCSQGLENGWAIAPDGEKATLALDQIDRSTLGRLLGDLKRHHHLDSDLDARLTCGLDARNRLIHGFYERHNVKIQTDEGRDDMVADLERLHEKLFQAWQIAGAASSILVDILLESASSVDLR